MVIKEKQKDVQKMLNQNDRNIAEIAEKKQKLAKRLKLKVEMSTKKQNQSKKL